MNSINQATFNMKVRKNFLLEIYILKSFFFLKGDTLVSCDSLGIVKLWDVRKVAVIESHDFGPYAANSVTFSPLSNFYLF